MSRPSGTQDRRQFRHYAKMAPDGTVAATIEVADGMPVPTDGDQNVYVEVTDLYPYDFRGVVVNEAKVTRVPRDEGVSTPDVQVDTGTIRTRLTTANKVTTRGR